MDLACGLVSHGFQCSRSELCGKARTKPRTGGSNKRVKPSVLQARRSATTDVIAVFCETGVMIDAKSDPDAMEAPPFFGHLVQGVCCRVDLSGTAAGGFFMS